MFNVGDYVTVDNGVSINGTSLSEIPGKVERVTSDYLFLQYDSFRYVANIKCYKKYK
ncbi:MAG: hypothetical protein SOZ71_10815 [Clostridium sp.]|nr:hypothetical protein [Clostridium sp.]